ncbi:MAG TPA: ABC transporter permease [Acidimicrobiales bacterium]|nr:ABC transporter permease [Acidimicrobiales bacterium]
MRRAALNVAVSALSLVLILLVWQAIIVWGHVAPYVAPRPWEAIRAVTGNWSTLWPLTLGTIRETVAGFVAGAVVGLLLAVAMTRLRVVNRLVYPMLILSQGVPIIALGPPLVLIFGFGIVPKVLIVAWITFFPVTVNGIDGLAHVDPDLMSLARVYGASRWRTFWHVELPAASTSLFSGLKIGATYAVAGAIIGELSASEGTSLAIYQQHADANFQTAAVYGTTMLMTVIGISWFLLMLGVEAWATPWRRRSVARRWPWTR